MDSDYDSADLKPVHVYFIEDTTSGYVKIGRYTGPPLQRLSELQTANPHPLRLLGVAKGIRPHEREMHRRLSDRRVGTGEWFDLPDHVREFIKLLPDGSDLLEHAEIPHLAPIPNLCLAMFRAGFRYREIGDFLGCSQETVRTAIPHRHRPRGRKGLADVHPDVTIEEFYRSFAATFDVFSLA